MRILFLVLLALLALPGLAAAQTPAPQTVSTRLNPPSRVGAFRLTAHRQREGTAGGFLQYRSPDSLEIVATIHPLPAMPDCERACDSAAVSIVATVVAASPQRLADGADVDSVKVEQDEAVSVPVAGAVAHGHHLAVSWRAQGKRQRAALSLYGLGSFLVEVRSTFTPGRATDSLAARFAREFVSALAQPAAEAQACATGPAEPEDLKVEVQPRAGAAELRQRMPAILAGLGFQVDPAVRESDVWQTLPVQGWPSGIDYGPWARRASPGFVVAVRLQEAAGAARVTVSARALCAPEAPQGEARALETSLELLTAREVAGKLDPRSAPR